MKEETPINTKWNKPSDADYTRKFQNLKTTEAAEFTWYQMDDFWESS